MILTIGNVVWLILIFILCMAIVVLVAENCEKMLPILAIGFSVSLVIVILTFLVMWWYNTNTESGKRAIKDTRSELEGGIYREITITAEDGREIFYYKGKVDIEMNHEDNYIKFESDDSKRYIIYYGIQDTIKIIECEEGDTE